MTHSEKFENLERTFKILANTLYETDTSGYREWNQLTSIFAFTKIKIETVPNNLAVLIEKLNSFQKQLPRAKEEISSYQKDNTDNTENIEKLYKNVQQACEDTLAMISRELSVPETHQFRP